MSLALIPSSPIWSAAMPAASPRFPGGTVRADVAVIGGGLAGLSAALHVLSQFPGARVLVLEADHLGAGASGRTSGMLGPGVGQSLLALARRFGTARAAALYRATVDAVREVVQLIEREGIDCQLEMGGQLHVARSPAARRRLAATAALLQAFQLPVECLDHDALAARIRLADLDGSSPGRLAALHLPIAGTLHPGLLLAGLAASVVRRGGTIFEGARVHDVGSSGPVHLRLDGGEVVAGKVIVTTGGYTAQLGLLRGRVLPLHLQILVTDPLDERSHAAIGWSRREGVIDGRRIFDYLRLTADNRILFGGGAPRYGWGGRCGPVAGESAALGGLARRLAATFPPGAAPRVAGGWTGVIDYTLDAMPAIHPLRERPDVLVAVGWCGHGVALSIAAGAWLARLLRGDAPAGALPWFRDQPPLVPLEAFRWLGVRMGVGMMSLMDRLE